MALSRNFVRKLSSQFLTSFLLLFFLLSGSTAKAEITPTFLATKLLTSQSDPLLKKMLYRNGVPEELLNAECDFNLSNVKLKNTAVEALANHIHLDQLSEGEIIFAGFSGSHLDYVPFLNRKVKVAPLFTAQDGVTVGTKEWLARYNRFTDFNKGLALHLSKMKFSKPARVMIADVIEKPDGYEYYAHILFENGAVANITVGLKLTDLQTIEENLTAHLKMLIDHQSLLNNPKLLARELATFKSNLEAAMAATKGIAYINPENRQEVTALLNESYKLADPSRPLIESELAQRYVDLMIAKDVANSTALLMRQNAVGFVQEQNHPFHF